MVKTASGHLVCQHWLRTEAIFWVHAHIYTTTFRVKIVKVGMVTVAIRPQDLD